MSSNALTETQFDSFELAKPIRKGLQKAGFNFCTPIQADALPYALKDVDVAGQAQTGTGKTATFLVATFQRLLSNPTPIRKKSPRALIIAPTRELAIQIAKDAEILGHYTPFKIGLIYGGTGYKQQMELVANGIDILVGTPGRLIDFYKQKIFGLRNIEVVVLDEADRMFDLGFIKDIRYLLRRTPNPKQRLGLLFSATLSYRVLELAYEHMNSPKLIRIEPEQVTAKSIKQSAYYPSNEQKTSLLVGLLNEKSPARSIVFVNTKRTAEQVEAYLNANGFNAGMISGDVPQIKRQNLLKRFQNNQLKLLIATDVAARGLHIPDVTHVFNFDLPQDVEDYVHRIGRTARLGASGEAISLVCEEYVYSLPEIEEYLGHKLSVVPITKMLLPEIKKPIRRKHRAHRGKNPNFSKNANRPQHKKKQANRR